MRRITIKSRLYATAIGIFVILFIIGIVANYYIGNALSHFDAMSLIKDISHNELQLRKLEKDFINLETKNIEFYKNQRSDYQDEFNELIKQVNITFERLKKERIIRKHNLVFELNTLKDVFSTYQKTFKDLAGVFLHKGFKDYGLIGQMRNQIHAVESLLERYPDYPEFKIAMLSLRRNEKDYLLRKDLKYLEKFKNNVQKLKKIINQTKIEHKSTFITHLDDYYGLFERVIHQDVQIGLSESMGLIHQLNKTNSQIEDRVTNLQQIIDKKAREEVNNAITTLMIVSVVLAIMIMSVLLAVTRRILYSLKKLRSFILRLGQGELPGNLTIKKNDEIADMIKSINVLLENLRNTREFANEVGNGNLEKQINVFNNEGDLGGALVGMRKQLLTLSKERDKNEKEAQKRNWINEGVAKFGDMMRQTENNLQELSYKVLSQLISYMGLNQGAIFLLDEQEDKKPELELVSAVAYGRKKLVKNRVKLGEELVGRCAFEKQRIYMIDVPDDYIKITSGLGYATPRVILLEPIIADDKVLGVIELAGFDPIDNYKQDFIEKVCVNIGTTVSAVQINERTQKLLERAKEQAEEISSQEEELRQNMEEMKATQEEASRREHELEMELHALHLSSAIVELNINGNILKVNELAQDLLGASSANTENRHLSDFVSEREHINKLNTLFRTGSRNRTGEARVKFEIHEKLQQLLVKIIPVANDNQVLKLLAVLLTNDKASEMNTVFSPETGFVDCSESDSPLPTFN